MLRVPLGHPEYRVQTDAAERQPLIDRRLCFFGQFAEPRGAHIPDVARLRYHDVGLVTLPHMPEQAPERPAARVVPLDRHPRLIGVPLIRPVVIYSDRAE